MKKFVTVKREPKKVPNDGTGQCDGCGGPLKAFKWRMGESTGCTKRCCEDDARWSAEGDMLGDDE
jgi:hypothetical protein